MELLRRDRRDEAQGTGCSSQIFFRPKGKVRAEQDFRASLSDLKTSLRKLLLSFEGSSQAVAHFDLRLNCTATAPSAAATATAVLMHAFYIFSPQK